MDSNPLYNLLVDTYKFLHGLDFDTVQEVALHAPTYYSQWWLKLYNEAPMHVYVETALVLFIVWLMFIRKTIDPSREVKNTKLSKKEVEWLIESWEPEPLVPALDERSKGIADRIHVVEEVNGNMISVAGHSTPAINFCSHDFLGNGQDVTVKGAAEKALRKYGCGSCGPRGFYGTVDVHLELEKAIADFMGTEEAIAYSDSAATISSAIPAFSKKGDLILVDEAVGEPVRTGVELSRSTVHYFKHNDMKDLRMVLQSIADDDVTYKRDATQQRRFIVVEGLYRLTGELCPLPEIIALKEEFKYRVILDESLSFGTYGATGRGLTEHFNVNIDDVDILTIALDTSLAAVGGACVGPRQIVDHQRLSGAGYCFSASSPPFFNVSAMEALKRMQNEPKLLQQLKKNSERLWSGLAKIDGVRVVAKESSPVIHVAVDSAKNMSWEAEEQVLVKLAEYCLDKGVAVSCTPFTKDLVSKMNTKVMRPTICLSVTATMTNKDIDKAISTIKKGAVAAFK